MTIILVTFPYLADIFYIFFYGPKH